jgi:hypothetical protein
MSEHALPTVGDPDARTRFIADGVVEGKIPGLLDRLKAHIAITMASLRGDRGPDPDYPPPPLTANDLERFIKRIARDHEAGVHIQNTGRSGPPSWQNKFLLGVGIALTVSAITTTATVIVTVASIRTRIEDYITSNDKRVDRVEHQTDDIQRRLDRGGGV